jgi:GAF domain-containing protein
MTRTPKSSVSSAADQLLSLMAEMKSLDIFLDQVVKLTARIVTPAAACGLTINRQGRPFTVANSSLLAAQVDEIQYGADEGPCLQTLRTGETIQVDDLAAELRWGQYRPHAMAHGVVSSLSMPLTVDGQVVAALNLYSTKPAAFAQPHRMRAEVFAAQCSAALTLVLRQADQAEIQHQLSEAMASRSVIDQAIGILMAQQRCTAAEAFDVLRQASQHRNRKLRDIAAQIITNVSGGPPQSPNVFDSDIP